MSAASPEPTPGILAKVLIPTDGNEPSLQAVTEVAPLVRAVDGEVVALFVRHVAVMTDPNAGEAIVLAEESLDELAQEVRDDIEAVLKPLGVRWSFLVREGDPSHAILETASEEGATMVALGATIHGQIAALFVSSVAEYLLHHLKLPLLVIRPDHPEA